MSKEIKELSLDELNEVAGGRLLNDTEVVDMENCFLKFKNYLDAEAPDNFDVETYFNLQTQYAQFMKNQKVGSRQYLFSDFIRDQGFGFFLGD